MGVTHFPHTIQSPWASGKCYVNPMCSQFPAWPQLLSVIAPLCLFLCRADNKVTVHFINRDGEKISVKGSPGDSLLDVIIDQDLDFDGFGELGYVNVVKWINTVVYCRFRLLSHSVGCFDLSVSLSVCLSLCLSGACEGTLACSTCHLIFEEDVYNQLGPITDEEMDMLDLAYGLTDTWDTHTNWRPIDWTHKWNDTHTLPPV